MRISVVDAFTDHPFAGNPAGVCQVPASVDTAWMQRLAAEMKHSETAFVRPVDQATADYELRWFTPAAEVELCGHATLATAHVLFDAGTPSPLRFTTRSGILTVRRGTDGLISMDFPAYPPTAAPAPPGLADALGIEPVWTGTSNFDLLVAVSDEDAVQHLTPDIEALGALPARGVIVTARASNRGDADFVSRFFAPRVGVPEDPVTGSAHCVLAPYWAGVLGRDDATPMIGRQLSPRGGTVITTMRGDRVELAGRAVTVLEGTVTPATAPE